MRTGDWDNSPNTREEECAALLRDESPAALLLRGLRRSQEFTRRLGPTSTMPVGFTTAPYTRCSPYARPFARSSPETGSHTGGYITSSSSSGSLRSAARHAHQKLRNKPTSTNAPPSLTPVSVVQLLFHPGVHHAVSNRAEEQERRRYHRGRSAPDPVPGGGLLRLGPGYRYHPGCHALQTKPTDERVPPPALPARW